eukprot:2007379-Rhodomonas_salina.4
MLIRSGPSELDSTRLQVRSCSGVGWMFSLGGWSAAAAQCLLLRACAVCKGPGVRRDGKG